MHVVGELSSNTYSRYLMLGTKRYLKTNSAILTKSSVSIVCQQNYQAVSSEFLGLHYVDASTEPNNICCN